MRAGLWEKAARIPNLSRISTTLPTALMRWLAGLPLRSLHRLGSVLGWATYGISPTYRRHLRENLASARYDNQEGRRRAIAAAGERVMAVPPLGLRRHGDGISRVTG